MSKLFSYQNMARFWSIVFGMVGLLFLFLPYFTGRILTLLARAVGLSGFISVPTHTLWYVLALSLMAILTILAWTSAAYPSHKETYYALLVAKGISTLGFLVLAYQAASAYFICAIADGFVGLTLWWSARTLK